MITFAGSPLDRVANRRDDAAWLQARLADPRTTVIALHEGKLLVANDRLVRLPASAARDADARLFLGVDATDAALFAIELERSDRGTFEEMRPLALVLPDDEAAIAGVARSLFEWHRRHGFCSVCGTASALVSGGWKRVCPRCAAEHFPRVDPVVIMLPLFGDRCLVGRQAAWPAGRYSALAGFLEPGESIEEACAREVKEEAGLTVRRVTYFASQPWPFPSSLMIGLYAEVEDDRAEPDGAEIESIRWLTRDQARAAVDGTHPEISAPARFAIATHLLAAWAAG